MPPTGQQQAAVKPAIPVNGALRDAAQRPLLRKGQAARRELFALALGLAAVLVVIKGLLLPFDVRSLPEAGRWALRLALVCSADVLFVALFAACCGCVSWLALHVRYGYRCWRPVMYALFYGMGVYAVFCMALFRITLQPFNIRMLTFVEGPMTMLDSIERYLTWPWVTSLAVVPLLLLLAPLVTRRIVWFNRGAPVGWKTGLAAVAVLVVYTSVSEAYISKNWAEPRRWERRISANPHMAFITSCVEELMKDEPFILVFNPDAYDTSDFTARERQDDQPAINLPDFPKSGKRPKNVIVLYLESVGAEYLRTYGAKHDTTPHLDKMLQEHQGVVFDNFYVSVPYSCKSMVALSSSVYPRPDWKLIVTESLGFRVPTITETLRDRGYRTCFAHSGYWSWRGRDRYLKSRVGRLLDAELLPERKISSWGVADQAMFEASLDWIDAEPEKPFFLLAYTIETHHPYASPSHRLDFDVDNEELDDYLNAIRATDENIAWLFAELEKRRLLEDTLVVITSDHGEAFGQHNQRSHNFGVYECNVHVPLILFHPGLKDYPRRITAVREQIDVAPTILDALGVESPAVWQGRNLFRENDPRPAYFFCVGNYVVLGLRDGRYKYHYYVNSGEEELFDVEADPEEEHNLAGRHQNRCSDYRKRVAGLAKYQRPVLERLDGD